MSDVYFVQTRTVYDSYTDYFNLARLSGYPVIYCDEIDVDSDNVYIFTPLNGENNHGWRQGRATIILADYEWRLKESDYAWSESDLTIPPGVSRVWASDKWYAERIHAQYVPLGSHPGLVGDAAPDPTIYDVAPLAYRTGRRNEAFGKMIERGLTIAPNAWDPERDAVLKSCKSVVHVHQHERVATVAPLRFAIAAAWHKPLISEQVIDRGIFDTCVLYADFSVIADYTALMTQRYPQILRDKADELHDTLCVSNSFKSYIESAL
jgi:hypothetical protein